MGPLVRTCPLGPSRQCSPIRERLSQTVLGLSHQIQRSLWLSSSADGEGGIHGNEWMYPWIWWGLKVCGYARLHTATWYYASHISSKPSLDGNQQSSYENHFIWKSLIWKSKLSTSKPKSKTIAKGLYRMIRTQSILILDLICKTKAEFMALLTVEFCAQFTQIHAPWGAVSADFRG